MDGVFPGDKEWLKQKVASNPSDARVHKGFRAFLEQLGLPDTEGMFRNLLQLPVAGMCTLVMGRAVLQKWPRCKCVHTCVCKFDDKVI